MALDRSKFKATRVAANKDKDDAVNTAMGRQGRAERADLHKIQPGKNLFRIYPPHPTGDETLDAENTFSEPVTRVFLPVMVEEKDDKGVVQMEGGKPKMKEINKPIFNSRIHGNTEKDLVEEYVALGKRIAEAMEAGKEKDMFLAKIVGKFSRNKDERLPGLLYKTSYAMYADRIENGNMVKFARLEVGYAVKEGMNTAAAGEDSNDPLAVDPWTDVEDGRAVLIDYNDKATKPADYYKVSMDNATEKVAGQKGLTVRTFPLTDEQLETYLKYDSLAKIFKGSFKKKDFEWQLKGLELFDQKNKLGIFDTEEFEEIMVEIAEYYSDEAEEAPTATEEAPATEEAQEEQRDAPTATVEEEEDNDELDLLTRGELKALKVSEGLDVKFMTTDTDDTIRQKIRAARKAAVIPHIDLPGEKPGTGKEVKEAVKEEVKKEVVAKESTADRLKRLRTAKK